MGREAGDVKVPSLIQAGSPRPLGATWTKHGINFALFSSNATRVEVALFDPESGAELVRCDLPARTGDIWHGLISPRARPGSHYAFYVHGPNEPQNGHRFDAAVALIDPYARTLSNSGPLRSRVTDGVSIGAATDRPPFLGEIRSSMSCTSRGLRGCTPQCRRTGAANTWDSRSLR